MILFNNSFLLLSFKQLYLTCQRTSLTSRPVTTMTHKHHYITMQHHRCVLHQPVFIKNYICRITQETEKFWVRYENEPVISPLMLRPKVPPQLSEYIRYKMESQLYW